MLAKIGDLEAELTTARTALASSAVPEQREFEALREKAAEAQAEREKLEKRAVSAAKDFEFTREQYQRASNQAAELASEVAGLQAEKVVLERRASENIVRIREMQARSEVAQLKDRIDELEAEAGLLKADLGRKNEELKARGVRGLRGASVPRSPKVAGMGIAGSRGSSVAPGEGNGFPPRWVGMMG
jgi:chromosome segregation ATPase